MRSLLNGHAVNQGAVGEKSLWHSNSNLPEEKSCTLLVPVQHKRSDYTFILDVIVIDIIRPMYEPLLGRTAGQVSQEAQ